MKLFCSIENWYLKFKNCRDGREVHGTAKEKN
jgi:hypothetical protein